MKNNCKYTAKRVTTIALMSALLVAGKFVLSAIPNIEVVTTLVIVFSVVFKFDALFATIVFCTLDVLIYPPSIDVVISYYIYWDALSLVSIVLSSLNVKAFYIYLAVGLIGTVCFGLITSAVYCALFLVPFAPYYLAGIPFYVAQFLSTVFFMSVGFVPLKNLLEKINKNVCNQQKVDNNI